MVTPTRPNHWAPQTRKRHQQEHRPQRPTERSDPTQHAKGRTGDRPGPRTETTTRRNVTQGAGRHLERRPAQARWAGTWTAFGNSHWDTLAQRAVLRAARCVSTHPIYVFCRCPDFRWHGRYSEGDCPTATRYAVTTDVTHGALLNEAAHTFGIHRWVSFVLVGVRRELLSDAVHQLINPKP